MTFDVLYTNATKPLANSRLTFVLASDHNEFKEAYKSMDVLTAVHWEAR